LAESTRQLERSNRELEQFAFAASHDLQEPLRKIEAFSEALLQTAYSKLSADEQDYLERMRKAAKRMRAMINGLLQLSRVTTQAQPVVEVDLAKITSEVLADLDHQVQRTGGIVHVADLPKVIGDPVQIAQLLQNLIGNALKFHPTGVTPEVSVWAEQDGDSARITVQDNGIGFDPGEAERMFQPFQRLVGISEYEGSGMGLAICSRIVQRHGGDIRAASQPGKGSTFVITLPRTPNPQDQRHG
jgi:signal transduction histidine kinase